MDAALRAQRLGAAHADASSGAEAEKAQKVLEMLSSEVVMLKLRNCRTPGCTGCSRVL